ncbi:MAG TPA: phosphatidylserine/phosphatidylglycerophosphate/cardiolipin synthase family protein [Gemmatimonadaceae bacterium]|nr:phosphatidylserine/phosphatidylglycerophosphate/cardiolipin synthase family protein [Gemmatimonadaceae bacterium]
MRGPSFARALWRIAAADVSSGNKVRILREGARLFDEMISAIESAKESISFEMYIFRRDELGKRFVDALAAAQKRGVRTRVLLDWIGRMGTPYRFFEPLTKAGAEVVYFNPPGFRRWLGLVPRDHRKVLVVDDRIGLTGGFGIGAEWQSGVLKRRSTPWRDTAVWIEGEATRYLADAFDDMWRRAGVRFRSIRREHRHIVRAARGAHFDPSVHPPALVGIIEGVPLRLRVSRALQLQALAAQHTIWIASAYFMPSWSEIEALAGAARDGVDVRVLVPSTYDHPWLRRLTTRFYRRLLRNGVKLWEWEGEMMHAKTNVIDSRWVRIGSTDFNPLGVAINYELDVIIEDATIARQAEDMFLEDLDHSRQITLQEVPR